METKNNDEYLENLVATQLQKPLSAAPKVKPGATAVAGLDLSFESQKKPKKESFSVHLDPDVHAALEKFAYKNRVSKSQVIEKILKQVLQA